MRKARNWILLGVSFCSCAQQQAWCGVKESQHDKERDAMIKKEQRERELQLNREENREEYLRAHPRELFNARIMGRCAIRDGKPVPFTKRAGTVQGITAGGGIVLSKNPATTAAGYATHPPCVVIFAETPQTVARGDKFSIPNVIADGSTCDYPLPSEPGKAEIVLSLKVYREASGITYKSFWPCVTPVTCFPKSRLHSRMRRTSHCK